MIDAQDEATPGFSSRWILDGTERGTPRSRRGAGSQQAHSSSAVATPVDTAAPAGTGPDAAPVATDPTPPRAEAFTVRVDQVPPTRSWGSRFGTWLARSIVAILFFAAVIVAAAALTSLYHTRAELDTARIDLGAAERDAATARDDATTAQDQITKLEREAATADAKVDELEAQQSQLELEVGVLRSMLVDPERATAAPDGE